MSGLRTSAKAFEDLRSIGRFTETTWGRSQRDEYLSKNHEAFIYSSNVRKQAQRVTKSAPVIGSTASGGISFFFRIAVGTVEIIRILHERMNVEDRLP